MEERCEGECIMSGDKVITAVVSVYNEERTVEGVVRSILDCGAVDELIVVDDGSTDNTKEILKGLSKTGEFRYIRFNKNKGKSYAMVTGVENASGDIIVFVDADLVGLKCEHIEKLITPLLSNEADMVIGARDYKSEPKIDITRPIDVWLGGERACYKKDLLPILDALRESKFGIETLLNLYFKSKNKTIKIVDLDGLTHLKKYEKYRFDVAALNYTKATVQITKAVINNRPLALSAIKALLKSHNPLDL